MPNFKYNMDFIPIPKDFMEHIMPQSNPAYVMVYMYIMFLAQTNKSADTEFIAKKLGLLETDVVNAIKYWNDKGIFSGTGDTIIVKKSVDEELSPDVARKSIEEVESIIKGDSGLSDLCAIAQEILGKTLGNDDLETLYWFYDQLGFSPEIITFLLEYCVSKNKRNMKYIEKVAITWHENNITTLDGAQAFISGIAKDDEYIASLKRLFGITDRNLSKTETLYLNTWRDELKMSADMVGLAYEYCIIATGKLSFPYINSIIKRWAEKGIATIPDAEKDHEEYKQGMSASGHEMSATENISELEKQFMSAYES